ncbi:hypothetical protein ZWY2020_033707 [Hordeum vulgare]|nr:hypothetical protein ZWY2020_033707 [Hordeum vulgare]
MAEFGLNGHIKEVQVSSGYILQREGPAVYFFRLCNSKTFSKLQRSLYNDHMQNIDIALEMLSSMQAVR